MHDMRDLQCLNVGITPGCYSHRHGEVVHQIGGGSATALKFQRAAKGDSGTALVTAPRVAVHRPGEQYPQQSVVSDQQLADVVGHRPIR